MSFAFAGASQDLRLRRGGDRVDCSGLLVSRVGVVCSNGVNLGENEPVGPGLVTEFMSSKPISHSSEPP